MSDTCPDCHAEVILPVRCACGLVLLSGAPDVEPERPYAVKVEDSHWVRHYLEPRESHVYGPGGPVIEGTAKPLHPDHPDATRGARIVEAEGWAPIVAADMPEP